MVSEHIKIIVVFKMCPAVRTDIRGADHHITKKWDQRGDRVNLYTKESTMPSHNDNSNDQKLGSESDRGFGSCEGRKLDQDKGSAHKLDSDEVCEAGIKGGQSSHGGTGYQNGGGQGNQGQATNADSGSTRGSSSEQHVETRRKGGQSRHGSRSEQLPSGKQEDQKNGTNSETGSTHGGTFEYNAEG